MKKMKLRSIAVLFLLIMIVPLFIACGEKEADVAGGANESAETKAGENANAEENANANAEEATPEPEKEPDPTPAPEPEPEKEPEPVPEAVPVVPEDPPYDHAIAIYNMEGELKNSITGNIGKLWNGASIVEDSDRGGKVLYLNNDDVVSPGEGLGYDQEGQWAELAAPYIPDSDAMTISIWFKLKEPRNWARAIDMGDARAQTLLAEGESGVLAPDRFVNISPIANTAGGDYLVGTFNCNDMTDLGLPNARDRAWADPADEGVWIHAVYVISKDGTPNVLYVNGVAHQSSNSNPEDDPEPAAFSPKDIIAAEYGLKNAFVGRSAHEQNGDQIMNGWIDDITIFDVALTANQIAGLKAADLKSR